MPGRTEVIFSKIFLGTPVPVYRYKAALYCFFVMNHKKIGFGKNSSLCLFQNHSDQDQYQKGSEGYV